MLADFFKAIAGCALEVIADGNRLTIVAERDESTTKSGLGNAINRQPAEHDDLGIEDLVVDDFETTSYPSLR